MIESKGEKVLLGDFHTHWYWDKENPACYLAGMKSMGLDFALLCDGWKRAAECDSLAVSSGSGFRFLAAKELGYGFAHIVVLLDDPAKEAELRLKSGNPSPEDAFRRAKELSPLVVFAHPGRNWSAAFDGKSFAPVARLFEMGLVDAIQTEDAEVYKEISGVLGFAPPSLGGIDCHACDRLDPEPPWLYGSKKPAFTHIRPCGASATALLCDSLDVNSIVKAVKDGLSARFDFDTGALVGASRATSRLEASGFKAVWAERKARRDSIEIDCEGMTVGSKGRIKVAAPKVASVSFPSSAAPEWKFSMALGNEIETPPIPVFNRRDSDYYPLAVELSAGEREIYAVLVKKPLSAKIDWRSEAKGRNGIRRIVVLELENNSQAPIDFEASVSGALDFASGSCSGRLDAGCSKTLEFEVAALKEPGFEYEAEAKVVSGGSELASLKAKVSFPLCRRLGKGASPWRRHDAPAVLRDKSQVMALTGPLEECWKGPDDASALLSLWWDERALHLFAEVRDSKFFQRWMDWETFWGDSIQFMIDPAKTRSRGYGTNYEFAGAFTVNGPELMLWYAPSSGAEQLRELWKDPEFKIERDETLKTTFYKLSLPWSRLAPFAPRKGESFNFMLLVNDNDGTVLNRKCALFYGGNLAELKDTSVAHSVTFR